MSRWYPEPRCSECCETIDHDCDVLCRSCAAKLFVKPRTVEVPVEDLRKMEMSIRNIAFIIESKEGPNLGDWKIGFHKEILEFAESIHKLLE